jgi:mannose-6-phosphate isomerase-like protein (cupin superfamily)
MRSTRFVPMLCACIGILLFAGTQYIAAQDDGGERTPPKPRLVWAAKPAPPTAYEAPNRLIWRVAEVLASHKGQASWRQPIAKTRDFEFTYVSMAPGEKTKKQFFADDRAFWWVYSGSMRVTLEGAEAVAPFVATKGFLVQAATRVAYQMETVGNEPVVYCIVTPSGQMPSYPIDETPTQVPGWTYIQTRITETGGYDKDNAPFLDFNKDVIEKNAGSSNFVWDGHTSAHIIRGKGAPTPPPTNLGHFHENMVEMWIIIEGELDFLIEGEQLVHGTLGDVVQAPNERWHRASFAGTGMATRLAITPRNKEGQVHYTQADTPARGGGRGRGAGRGAGTDAGRGDTK